MKSAAPHGLTYQLVFGRSCGQPLDGEVGDGMEGQVDQLALQMVLVEITEEGLVGKLHDGLDEATRGLILQEHQEWTAGKSHTHTTQHILSACVEIKSNLRILPRSSLTSLPARRCGSSGTP